MLTTLLVIYGLIYLLLLFKFKIKPSKCIYPMSAIPTKHRKLLTITVALLFVLSLFIPGSTPVFVFTVLGASYIFEYKQLKEQKSKYYSLLNTLLFLILALITSTNIIL